MAVGALCLAVALAVSCGGEGVEGRVDPVGGEVCLPNQEVCISVPSGALERDELVRIAAATLSPEAAIGKSWDIAGVRNPSITFLKPAQVRFKLELLPLEASGISNDNLLRIYTFAEGEWVPLDNPALDRVRGFVLGETSHLSPFVVLRADRLPDGGLPIEGDGGQPKDSGVIIIPPIPDAGRDAGPPDAGRPDAGPPDAGPPDAGPPDAGPPDAGPPDAGPPDAGPPDAGPPDAGPPDAGPPDAGPPDAGPPDAGPPDAGIDAGIDAGVDAGVDAGPDDGGADGGDGG